MKSLPVAVKVGSAGVLGGGGIAGTGLLIHDQIQKSKIKQKDEDFKLGALDTQLIEDSAATLSIKDDEAFSFSGKEVTIKVKATSSKQGGTAISNDKWVCIIKGKGAEDLSTTNFDNNQKSKFTTKLGTTHKEDQNNFVKSCARNRTGNAPDDKGNWTATIVVDLTKTEGKPEPKKYEFPEEAITSIFAGTWKNK